MTQLTLNLPDDLKFAAEQAVTEGRYASVSEYVSDLIRKDQCRGEEKRIEQLLRQRVAAPSAPMTDAEFDRIRQRLDSHIAQQRNP
jgi:Arc/MetJ-type ribon-helix-helix transcriptional regulator